MLNDRIEICSASSPGETGEAKKQSTSPLILAPAKLPIPALSVFFDGALHWLRESGDIVAFHVEEERAYNMALPQGVTLRHVAGSYCSAWLGVAAGYTSLVDFDDEEIYVQVTTEKVGGGSCSGAWHPERLVDGAGSFTTATGACPSHGIGCVSSSGCRCTG
ncbi:hypothetical protein B296_00019778 [Ensete ventricosum]|uniref:Uncharacterized protein n=1 Tax=Ensete ventricosum TaxID=4639 RepID=A0A427AKQ3_ENSVE|nr:hypothetical protein B296_00019778 [Ensete ventricosum]